MLVLSRQRDETIMIGDEIEITVVDIRGDKVRLGITAPTRIAVHRKEVYEAIRRENEQAAELNRRMNSGDLDVIHRTISPGPARTKVRPAAAASNLATRPVGSTCPEATQVNQNNHTSSPARASRPAAG
jgi:carbon storage regulator